MIHGGCGSIGCFSMTDNLMDEIYTITYAARLGGQQNIPIHSFPFPMTRENMEAGLSRFPNQRSLWDILKRGWDFFEETRVPPRIGWGGRQYSVRKQGRALSAGDRSAAEGRSGVYERPNIPSDLTREARPGTSCNTQGSWYFSMGGQMGIEEAVRHARRHPEVYIEGQGRGFVVRSVCGFSGVQEAVRAGERVIPDPSVGSDPNYRGPTNPAPRDPAPRRNPPRRGSSSCSTTGPWTYQVGVTSRSAEADRRAAQFPDIHVVRNGMNMYRLRSICRFNSGREAADAARANGHREAVPRDD